MMDTDISIKENNRTLLLAMIIALLGILALVMVASTASAAFIDWTGSIHTVVGTETYVNDTIDADDVDVPVGATLILKNTTLSLNWFRAIDVDGTMEIHDNDNDNTTTGDRSVIQARPGQSPYFFMINDGADFLMENSELTDVGTNGPGYSVRGLWSESENTTISYNEIHHNYYGIIIEDGIATIDNNTIYDCPQYGIFGIIDGEMNITDNWIYDIWINYGVYTEYQDIYADGNLIEDSEQGWMTRDGQLEMSNTDILDIDRRGLFLFNAFGNVSDSDFDTNFDWQYSLVYVDNSDFAFSNCLVTDATDNGFHIYSGSTVDIDGSTIEWSEDHGIESSNSDVTISDTKIRDNDDHGIQFSGSNNDLNIDDNTNISDNWYDGIRLTSAKNFNITDSVVYNNWDYGIFAYSGDSAIIENTDVTENSYTGIYIHNFPDVYIANGTSNVNGFHGIYSYNVQNFQVDGNELNRNHDDGIYISSCTNVIIANGSVNDNRYHGIWANTLTNLIIDNNDIDRNWDNGIYISNSIPYVDITDNDMDDNWDYGIYVSSPNLNIEGNFIRDSGYMSIRIYSSGTNGMIKDNTLQNSSSYNIHIENNNNLDIDNNFIDNPDGYAIYCRYSYVDITNNTFNGSGSYSIYFEWAYTSTLVGNTFKNPRYSGDFVYMYYSSVVLIDDNDFDGTSYSSWYAYQGLNFYQINVKPVITNNTFKNLGQGIYIYDSWGWTYDGLVIEGNSFENIIWEAAVYLNIRYYQGKIQFNNNDFKDVYNSDAIYLYIYYSHSYSLYFENNTFDNVRRAVYYYNDYWPYYYYPTLTYKNNTVNGTTWSANYFRYIGNAYLANNTITNGGDHGYYFSNLRYNMHVVGDRVENMGYTGMEIQWDYDSRTLDIRDSKYLSNGRHGFYSNRVGYIYLDNVEMSGNGDSGFYGNYNYYYFQVNNSKFNNNNDRGFYHRNTYGYYDQGYFENCEFNGNNIGYYGYRTAFTMTNSSFQNNTDRGIYMYGNGQGQIEISNNVFYDNFNTAIYNNNHPWSGSSINDNVFIGNGYGIWHNPNNDAWVYERNTFERGNYGIYASNDMLVVRDSSFKFLNYGVYSYDGMSLIDGNTFTNIFGSAIELDEEMSSTITNNDIRFSNYGVYADESMVNLMGNVIVGNEYGVYIDYGFAFLSNEMITDNAYGVTVSSYSFAAMEDVSLENNYIYGIHSHGSNFMSYTVVGDVRITNNLIQMNGNIIVQDGGTLTVESSEINFDSPGGAGLAIMVENRGTLLATGMDVRAKDPGRPFGFMGLPGSEIVLTDCSFKNVGFGTTDMESGLYIAGIAALDGVTIEEAYNGLYVTAGVDITMRNSTIITASNLDIYIELDSILRTGNTEFDQTNVLVLDTSMIIVERIIKVNVYDDVWDPYPGVSVRLESEGFEIADVVTGDNGVYWDFFEGAIISADGFSETLKNYNLTLDDGNQTFNDTFYLTDDYEKDFDFGVAPTLGDGENPVTVEENDVLELDLTLYFIDNDALTYAVEGNTSILVDMIGDTAFIYGMEDWYGIETFTIIATDTHGLTVEFDLTVNVTPLNNIPIIEGVPDLVLNEDEDYVLDLLQYIYDPDTPQSELVVTLSTSYATVVRTTVTFNYPVVTIEYVRITVSDGHGQSSQDILVNVIATNDPPELVDLPLLNATEDEEKIIDFITYLFDEDTNLSRVSILSEAPEVILINGTKLTFLFPQGDLMRTVAIMVTDGDANRTYDVLFYINPVNDGPELADLPLLTVSEGLDFLFDLEPYMSDVDDDLNELTITTDHGEITVEGMLLIINIQEGGSVVVTVTLSDGRLSDTGTLRITVTEVNDPPALSKGKVNKKSGTTDDTYKFTVTLTDPDAEYPTVYVVINGHRYAMKHDSGAFATGAEFSFKKELGAGDYTYRFEVDDGSGAPNGQGWTEEYTNLRVSEPANYLPILLLIIILVVIAFIILLSRSKKRQEDPIDLSTMDEDEDEDEEGTAAAFAALDEEDEDVVDEEDEDEDEEEDEVVEDEDEDEEEEEDEETALITKDSDADLDATDTEADLEETTSRPRKAKDTGFKKDEDAKEDTSHGKDKASESEVDGGETDLDSLMADIMTKKKK